ncbi:tyrosine-protein kinase ITK/TSK isoform X1 [Synchiropus splendidus]|uniref:tyrosine-protein kinase ITK/TSK isoform X1 n=2 Tax=Synchiropus splendidus TaxID=270530 RepID=UPI00237E04B2|nr:tyrosine-protein kinase ITK/TSK isoform X1 [Synchiropus splendidus]
MQKADVSTYLYHSLAQPILWPCGYPPQRFFFFIISSVACSFIFPSVPLVVFQISSTMFPRVLLKETLIKKSQQKKRTSPCNYKERFFVLDTKELRYSEHRPGKKPVLKGSIMLSRIKCVEIVLCDLPIPCDYKYPFQVFHDNHFLYIYAPDNDCRQKWVRTLKEETKGNNLVSKYHPNFWVDGKWRCCQQIQKLAMGCHVYEPVGYASKKPLPQVPDGSNVPTRLESDSGPRSVIALQDYTPQANDDLPLQKDQEYTLIDGSHPDWWTVQDNKGNLGFVPSTHVTEKCANNIEQFEWYSKDVMRAEAEELLIREGKEGAFMVRDSRQAGVYTVSVFTKAAGLNNEKNARVKHYQIRRTEGSEAAFYLAERYLFSTIPELIQYHQHNAAGLITRLRHIVSREKSCSQAAEDPAQDQWEVQYEELRLGQELGCGQFGLVVEGRWRNTKVAVKMLKGEGMSDDDFKEEARVMMRMRHSKLVQLYGVCTKQSPMCLIFEFMDRGCLSDYLRANKGSLSQKVMMEMCLDVNEGMAYLESSNFIHRDLAARNCLVSKDGVVKVSDFGMTRFVLDDQYTSSFCSKFPVKWSSPEVIRHNKFSSKSDVWSFGVLMWEVYNEGRLPYENRSNSEVAESLNAGLRLLKPRLAPEPVYLLMDWCWKEKPSARPTFAQLLNELTILSSG